MSQDRIAELIGLVQSHIDESNKKHDRTYNKLEQQDTIINAILIQAQKTNGRVLSLEKTREENEKKFQTLETLNNYKWWATGIFFVIMAMSGTFYTLSINNLKYELKQELTVGVEEMLDQRIKGIYLDSQ